MSRRLRSSGTHRRLVATLIAAGLGVVFASDVSYAFWTGIGSGSGSASATGAITMNLVALTGGDVPNVALLPGSSGEVIVKINNPNSVALKLTSVVGNGTITTTQAGCSAASVSFTNQTGLSVSLPANAVTLVRLSNATSLGTGSVSACQGASFSIPVTATVQL